MAIVVSPSMAKPLPPPEPNSYTACGCGCCPGTDPEEKCLYRSRGHGLEAIMAQDKKARSDPRCAMLGCGRGLRYRYCEPAPAADEDIVADATRDYSWIPPGVLAAIRSNYPGYAVPTEPVRSRIGDESYFRDMLEGGDPRTAYSVLGDFNGDRRQDFGLILFPTTTPRSPRYGSYKVVVGLAAGVSEGAPFRMVEIPGGVGPDYFLTLEQPGTHRTAAGKGFAADPGEPKTARLRFEGIGLHKAGSASSLVWWDGKQFKRTFISD